MEGGGMVGLPVQVVFIRISLCGHGRSWEKQKTNFLLLQCCFGLSS